MKRIIQSQTSRQFIKFCLVGGLSALVDWSIYIFLTRLFGFWATYYIGAKAISFVISACGNFYLNRRFTFRSTSRKVTRQAIIFFIVATAGLFLNTGFMYLMVEKAHLYDLIALVIATGVVTFWNFTANKFITFKEKRD